VTDELKLALYGLHRGSSADPDTLARRAQRAEQAGFESLWVGDHLLVPPSKPGEPAGQDRLEAVTVLAHLAGVTNTVGLAAGVIVAPQRQPVLLAKQLTTVDHLAKGRLIVGIGVGYVEFELRALGASLADRAARTDECVAALRALWAGTPVFDGRFVSFAGEQYPRPTTRPHPPIVIGGTSPAALRRAITTGNGWYGFAMSVDATAATLAELRAAAATVPRPAELGELEISITPDHVPDLDTARRYAELGVHRLIVQPPTMDGTAIDDLIDTVSDTLIGRLG
jgi:probable F420-dependent oxidoreductase